MASRVSNARRCYIATIWRNETPHAGVLWPFLHDSRLCSGGSVRANDWSSIVKMSGITASREHPYIFPTDKPCHHVFRAHLLWISGLYDLVHCISSIDAPTEENWRFTGIFDVWRKYIYALNCKDLQGITRCPITGDITVVAHTHKQITNAIIRNRKNCFRILRGTRRRRQCPVLRNSSPK